MRTYILKRILLTIPVLIGISVIIFSLVHLAPGDPYSHMISPQIIKTSEDYENMLRAVGYYDPLPVKYFKWTKELAVGNLGYSIHSHEPVSNLIKRRLRNTLLLSIPALILSTIIAIPLGVISATKQYSIFDYLATLLAFIGISIPAFFFALLLVKYVAFDLGIFQLSGMSTIKSGYTGIRLLMDRLSYMVLPITVLTFIQIAGRMRYTRSAMLEVVRQDYIRTARAKGLSERVVIYKHALRNALIPIVTILSLSLAGLLSGAVLTERVFKWPGMGTMVFQAISNRDYPVVMAGTMVLALVLLLANVLADILYAFVDPRIRYD
ncbi:ABC transporter permease [Clostridium sp. 'deep sea']|uniref:ABC transporter permease n=1 Tax=Clostridium sp. 'deep sea' TaxID=2779445 RepID=UPI0018969167|nr:ABC transporter permease [Clostridium sp. 'deep sea']QOR34058.1 ABC transporter permease [Clostridium sp. 'deep sea']